MAQNQFLKGKHRHQTQVLQKVLWLILQQNESGNYEAYVIFNHTQIKIKQQ